LTVNKEKIEKELNEHWEVLAEPIQMLMRKLNVEGAYEQLKALTRGKDVKREDIEGMIEGLKLEEGEKKRLRGLKVWNYVGNAEEMAKNIKKNAKL
jgi:adenylosuccinate lyase